MGFGSYTEDDQEQQDIDTGEIDIQQDTRTEFEGELAFDSGATTTDLLSRLSEIKDEDDDQQE